MLVGLKNAYDSVPMAALWKALWKLGIPETVVAIIQSFHDNMCTQIDCNGKLLEDIKIDNGLRQGCSMAPTLVQLVCKFASGELERTKGSEGYGNFAKLQAGWKASFGEICRMFIRHS